MNLQAFLLFKLQSAYFTLMGQHILLHHASKNVYRLIGNLIHEISCKNVICVGGLIYHRLLCKVRQGCNDKMQLVKNKSKNQRNAKIQKPNLDP